MVDHKLLQGVAESILRSINGPGYWDVHSAPRGYKKPDDALSGLSVGDVVYSYNEEEEALTEERVIAVVDGVGFVLYCDAQDRPGLLPVVAGTYGHSREAAITEWRADIEADIKYCQARADNLAGLKSLLREIDGECPAE
jgi:hypothetical protein